MKYLSLFSGIGGFDLGFDRAGMTCVGQVEIDDFCRRVLAKHWPDVKRMADIREVKGDEFGTVDLICGGFPCQPHSLAGKRKGAEDDRNLWPEYRRLVDAIRPRWVVGENVPGLAYTMLDEIISDLENLQYEVVTFDIPAIAFDAPHIRRRLFIVAHAKSERINRGLQSDAAQWREDEQESNGNGKGVAHAEINAVRPGLRPDESPGQWRRRSGNGSSTVGVVSKPDRAGRQEQWRGIATREEYAAIERSSKWPAEPGMGRMAYGVSDRVGRLKSLGNAVVPQVAEWLGRRIMEVENSHNPAAVKPPMWAG